LEKENIRYRPKNSSKSKMVFYWMFDQKEEAGSIVIKMEYHPNVECKNIPIDEIPDRISEIPKEKSVAVFCSANVRSAIVYAYLLSKGFSDIRIVEGGYSALTEALKPGKVLEVLQKNAE